MSAAFVFTEKKMGIDYRVWLSMLVICFICLGLLGYQHITHYQVRNKACALDTITVNGKGEDVAICYLNRLSYFGLQLERIAKVEWDFGDGTTIEGTLVSHQFLKTGNYWVKASINGNCNFETEVIVKNPIAFGLNKREKTEVEIFQNLVNPKVGNTVTFEGVPNTLMQINSYDWKLLNDKNKPILAKNDSAATFTFNSPGKYIIQLIINNNPSLFAQKEIDVVADAPPPISNPGASNVGSAGANAPPPILMKPEEDPFNNRNNQNHNSVANTPVAKPSADSSKPAAVKLKVTDIKPDAFKDLLQDVIDGNTEVETLYDYLDLKQETRVEVNGDKHLEKLRKFIQDIKSKKNNKIVSLSFERNENNSIQIINVTLKKRKGPWSWLPFTKD